jgi:hypothetical protein
MDFKNYDNMHPEIWESFKEISFQTKAKGFLTYSAKGIFEIIRWHRRIPNCGDDFKVNNNFAPDYARKMEKFYPEFENFFRKRMLKKLRN